MNVFVTDDQPIAADVSAILRLAEQVLVSEGFPDDAAVAVALVTDEVIADHNERFMGRPGPTDVLAFPLEHLEPGAAPTATQGDPPIFLGDVIIAPATVRAQADEHGVAFDGELALMVVHGILHLMGYDHVDDGDAQRMEGRERDILAEIGMVRT